MKPNAALAALQLARAESTRASRDWSGWCLKFVRMMLGLPWVANSAAEAWADTDPGDRHKGATPPAGVPVYWSIGEFGHVAISAGGGKVFSTDIRRAGRVDLVPIGEVASTWGARYLGWASTLGEFTVYTPPKKATPRPRPSPGRVTVRAGDTISALVLRHSPAGTSWEKVWLHDRNDALRALRRRPEHIRAGDEVWLP